MAYSPNLDKQLGRNLISPWRRPYIVEQVLSSISYLIRAEKGSAKGRIHVNRLKRNSHDVVESEVAIGGVLPDSRRIIRGIVAERKTNGNQ